MIQIGSSRRPPPADITDALLECHGRIRSVTSLAVRLAAAEAPLAPQIVEAARRLRRYFAEALPRHIDDEETIVLPRLEGLDRSVDDALAQMSREHREHQPAIDDLIALSSTLEAEPERHRELRVRLRPLARSLADDLGAHLALEETRIIGALPRLLVPEKLVAMLGELRFRREEINHARP